ncbi:MAG: HAMP domain-containing histidine kinase [Nitrospinota bacterium]|nr:HAMP domain-containing histidine kinase [Nitrospinota bacterium]
MTEYSWLKKLFFPVGLAPGVEAFILQTYSWRLRIGVMLGILFLLAANLPDTLLAPGLFWKLFITRMLAVILCFYALYLLRRGGSIIYLTRIFYFLVLVCVITSGIIIYITGGCHSHWALVSGLVVFIALTVSLLPPRIIFIVFIISFTGYLIPAMMVGFQHHLLQTYTHLFFYAGFGVLSVSVSALQHEMILKTVAEITRFKQTASSLKVREEELSTRNMELQKQKDKAQDMHRAQSEFLDNISHELRTPLTSIIGFSNLLESSGVGLGKNEMQMLGKIQSQGESLLELIENLMDLSSISSSSLTLDMKPVFLPLVIHQVVDSLQQEVAASGHQVVVDCKRDIPRVTADHERLTQVFTHLFSNAVKFTPKGEGRIEIGCQVQDGRVVAFVRDNGIGIEPGKSDLIFQMFRQLDGSNTRKHGGAGIGLPIVRRIVDLHGADLQMKSEPGKGTEFLIIFQGETLDNTPANSGNSDAKMA